MTAEPSGRWRAQLTDDGSWTLASPVHGETCHSLAGAWTQARERYASIFADLSEQVRARGRVRLLDVGTGLGLNLAAALEACEGLGLALEAASFEQDPEVLRAALRLEREHPSRESHRRALAAIELCLDARDAAQRFPGALDHHLELHLGDARAALPALAEERRFDAVFLDPFSPRVDPPLWAPEFLAEVARRMDPGARLATYTTSLSVRAELARAGLEIGAGPRVGRKAAGTLAARAGSVPPLDERTRLKLARKLAAEPRAGPKTGRGEPSPGRGPTIHR